MLIFLLRMPLIAVIMAFFLGFASPEKAHSLTWKMPPHLFTSTAPEVSVALAADINGNAFTAANANGELSVTRFSNLLQAYGAPVIFSENGGAQSVATNATLTALTLWYDFGTSQIFSAFYNGTSWGATSSLETIAQGSFGTHTSLAMNGSGNGLAAWDQSGPTAPGDITVSFFNGGSEIFGPLQNLNPAGTGGYAPIVDYSSNGTAVAIWGDNAGNLLASNFNGTSWTTLPPVIATGIQQTFSNPPLYDVQIDATGHAIAIFVDATSLHLFASFYNGSSWGTPQDISLTPAPNGGSLALSPSGSAILAWSSDLNVGSYSEFISGSWTLPTVFAPLVEDFAAAIDSSGNTFITWDDFLNTFSIYKPVGGVFGPSDLVAASSDLTPHVAALSDNGRGFIDGLYPVGEALGISGTYSLVSLPTPIISGRVCKNKFAAQSERLHVVTFIPVMDPTIVSYNLFRNGVLIAVIPSTGPFIYVDPNRCRRDVYTLTAVNSAGISGPAATIILR